LLKPASSGDPPSAAAWANARPPLLRFLTECHATFSVETGGMVANYIPELGKADPDHFGIALATIDGHVYEVGDTRIPFTIQSMSKAFVFALALDTLGATRVESTIGVEPSGEPFNSIRLNADNHPFNRWSIPARSPVRASFMKRKVTAPSTASAPRSAVLPGATSASTSGVYLGEHDRRPQSRHRLSAA